MNRTIPAPRHDAYRNIHKGLRAMMFDAVLRVGSTDPQDAPALAATLEQVDRLLGFMAAHVKHENEHLHTAIEARTPGGARRTTQDHHEHVESLAALRAQVAALRGLAMGTAADAMHALYLDLAEFVAENLQHMRVEETQNNAQLWLLYSDAELVAIHDRLLASVEPPVMAEGVGWMSRALTLPELVELLTEARNNVPAPVFDGMLALIGLQVDAARWAALNAALERSDAALAA